MSILSVKENYSVLFVSEHFTVYLDRQKPFDI